MHAKIWKFIVGLYGWLYYLLFWIHLKSWIVLKPVKGWISFLNDLGVVIFKNDKFSLANDSFKLT